MRQILSFVFVGLFAGCHGSENPVVSPDDAAGDAMASDSSANAAKMTVSAGTAGGGSNRQVPGGSIKPANSSARRPTPGA